MVPVSYTHLDVYKRQFIDWPPLSSVNGAPLETDQLTEAIKLNNTFFIVNFLLIGLIAVTLFNIMG